MLYLIVIFDRNNFFTRPRCVQDMKLQLRHPAFSLKQVLSFPIINHHFEENV